jgi:hypothetical protein
VTVGLMRAALSLRVMKNTEGRDLMLNRIIQGDCAAVLKTLPAASKTGSVLTERPLCQQGRTYDDPPPAFAPKSACHTFRATGITAYLKGGGRLEVAQQMANHESSRTTGLYDRRGDDVSLDEVERIGIRSKWRVLRRSRLAADNQTSMSIPQEPVKGGQRPAPTAIRRLV